MSTSDNSSSIHESTLSPFGFLVELPASSDYSSLWIRTQMAMSFVWDRTRREGSQYDFILKVRKISLLILLLGANVSFLPWQGDDDTFVFVENLLKFLQSFDSEEKLYLGHLLHT